MKQVKIVVFVPKTNTEKVRLALGNAGAGVLGEYSFCSFSCTGIGRFMPSKNAQPHIGSADTLEQVEEERIEVTVAKSKARAAVDAIKSVHPYEEIALDIYPLLDISEL